MIPAVFYPVGITNRTCELLYGMFLDRVYGIMNCHLAPQDMSLLQRGPAMGPRVLVVDDEPAVLFAYRKLMEHEGMTVDVSSTLQGALEQIRANPYLAVITDLRLSGTDNRDGLEVMRVLQQERPETKVICTTGYGCCEIEQQVRQLGAEHYFEKPVSPHAIVDILKKLKQRTAGIVKYQSISCCSVALLWLLR